MSATSIIPAKTTNEVPTACGQPNVSSVSNAALMTPTTSSDRIRMPNTPVPIFDGDQNISAVVGRTNNNEIASKNGRLDRALSSVGMFPTDPASIGY